MISKIQPQLAQQLGVTEQAVSNRLQEIGKIQYTGRWVPHELNDKQMEKCKNMCEILFAQYETKSFCIL